MSLKVNATAWAAVVGTGLFIGYLTMEIILYLAGGKLTFFDLIAMSVANGSW